MSFGEAGLSEDVVKIGWSGQEKNYRWADGPITSLKF